MAARRRPDLWWQAHHGWATIAMTQALAQENGGAANAAGFVILQIVMVAPVLIGVWILGLRFLWRSGRPLWRALAWSYGLLFIFFAATAGAKPYYLAAAYFFLLAAGAVAVERRWATGRGRSRIVLAIARPACLLLTLPLDLPVLPVLPGRPGLRHRPGRGRDDRLARIRQHRGHRLASAAGPAARQRRHLRGDFAHVRIVATISNSAHVNQEEGGHVYICTGPVRPWGQLWPSFRYDS